MANGFGEAQPTIPLHAIRALKIPQPPLAEQYRIVTELDALLPAVLDRAFAGAL